MISNDGDKDKKELIIDAAIGLLKFSYMKRRKMYYGEKIKKNKFQQDVLNSVYEVSSFPSTETRCEIALLLGIPQRSVQVWFQNKRQLSKKREGTKQVKIHSDELIIKDNIESEITNDDEVFDIPSLKLVEIIEHCKKKPEKY
ncbi:homeobox domain-containing protein [Hamiltosporidium tvaerminnensis]|uniref:Homeobox domain-containing protein n=2 Tax=Hamiltosporidium TaxID=1176354 RepID=A0A4Q9KZ12_9MICR|nr:hypothetical protein LUQ84_002930 [Hamiltosporidium tvaerminnensis]TBU00244.1 homeobox domain-containing protein [Hamiltosporidium magnivora]TBU03602.1 homeobox domain-containing protein [Hamiltosporidium tvaerminnensis]TBU05985.1 homeobox domain-containing protein [Hamiltosporidium magnivora]TBU20565.1 homeobox domain-containing protein [Hamiltosporidium tvaerminnensis]